MVLSGGVAGGPLAFNGHRVNPLKVHPPAAVKRWGGRGERGEWKHGEGRREGKKGRKEKVKEEKGRDKRQERRDKRQRGEDGKRGERRCCRTRHAGNRGLVGKRGVKRR